MVDYFIERLINDINLNENNHLHESAAIFETLIQSILCRGTEYCPNDIIVEDNCSIVSDQFHRWNFENDISQHGNSETNGTDVESTEVLNFRGKKISMKCFVKLHDLLRAGKVSRLILSETRFEFDTKTKHFSDCIHEDAERNYSQSLKYLDLSKANIGSMNVFAEWIFKGRFLKNIQYLNLSGSCIGGVTGYGDAVEVLVDFIKNSVYLESINLSRNNMSDRAIHAIAVAVVTKPRNICAIKNIDFSTNHISSKAATSIGWLIRSCYKSLSFINLSSCMIDGAAAKSLSIAASVQMSNCGFSANNFGMDLSYNRISSSGLAFLGRSLIHSKFIHFASLQLRCNSNHFDEFDSMTTAMCSFMDCLVSAPYLKVLDISGNTFDSSVFEYFFVKMTEVKRNSLIALNISRCWIGFWPMQTFFKHLQSQSSSLRIIDLECNHLGHGTLVQLKNVLKKDNLIQYIKIGESINQRCIQEIRELPSLEVLKFIPYPLHLKVFAIMCFRLPKDALVVVFEFLKIPLVRRVSTSIL